MLASGRAPSKLKSPEGEIPQGSFFKCDVDSLLLLKKATPFVRGHGLCFCKCLLVASVVALAPLTFHSEVF